jgi:TolA-binding protein
MSEMEPTTRKKGGFGRFLLGVLRVFLVLAIGILVGTAGFFGVQYLLQQATAPAEANAQRLEGIETQQASVHGQLDERMADFNERLADLEAQADVTVNELDEIRGNEDALADVVSQLDQNLGGLGKLESELEIELAALRSTVAVMSTKDAVALLTPTMTPTATGDLEALKQEVKMLKALELLSRSRLHFLNADYGLAEKDLQNAYRVLTDLQVAGLAPETEMYNEAMSRLQQAGRHLPASPRIAENDLETAWDLLVEILTNPGEEKEAATPTSALTTFATFTAFPTYTSTPTPMKSPESSNTPTITRTPWETPTPSTP